MRKDNIIESGNVFADMGLANSREHLMKAKLVSQMSKIMKGRRLTQIQAARVLGIDQPKISAMLNGHFRGFSVYRLMSFVAELGGEVKVVTKIKSAKTSKLESIRVG